MYAYPITIHHRLDIETLHKLPGEMPRVLFLDDYIPKAFLDQLLHIPDSEVLFGSLESIYVEINSGLNSISIRMDEYEYRPLLPHEVPRFQKQMAVYEICKQYAPTPRMVLKIEQNIQTLKNRFQILKISHIQLTLNEMTGNVRFPSNYINIFFCRSINAVDIASVEADIGSSLAAKSNMIVCLNNQDEVHLFMTHRGQAVRFYKVVTQEELLLIVQILNWEWLHGHAPFLDQIYIEFPKYCQKYGLHIENMADLMDRLNNPIHPHLGEPISVGEGLWIPPSESR